MKFPKSVMEDIVQSPHLKSKLGCLGWYVWLHCNAKRGRISISDGNVKGFVSGVAKELGIQAEYLWTALMDLKALGYVRVENNTVTVYDTPSGPSVSDKAAAIVQESRERLKRLHLQQEHDIADAVMQIIDTDITGPMLLDLIDGNTRLKAELIDAYERFSGKKAKPKRRRGPKAVVVHDTVQEA